MGDGKAWRIIDCTDLHGQLRHERGRIMVYADDTTEPVAIPLAQTAVILLGLHASISTALLTCLAQEGVSVLCCDWKGMPVGAFDSWGTTPSRVTARHWAQVDMSLPRAKNAWMQIVKAKIRGQSACLDSCGRPMGDLLRNMAKTVHTGDASNVEGMAARTYWQNLFPVEEQFHRQPGSGIDRNALLDYGYTILRGMVIRSILTAGLDPVFGVNHCNRSNYFCLADDLIEPYRPAIDYCVANMDWCAGLDRSTKTGLVAAATGRFNDTGETVPASLDKFASRYARYCEKQTDTLDPPVFQPPRQGKTNPACGVL